MGARDVAFDDFGFSVASAGDGDGFADLIVGAHQATNNGQVFVYRGSPTGISTTPSFTLNGPQLSGSFGRSVASAGDVNGDGYADVIIGAPTSGVVPTWAGKAYLFLGGAAGLPAVPSATFDGVANSDQFGIAVASVGDVNADGYAHVAVGANSAAGYLGQVTVYLGSPAGLATSGPVLTGPAAKGSAYGITVASAGDVNGDGFADLVVGAPDAAAYLGTSYVYLGGATGLSAVPTPLMGTDAMGFFGLSVSSAGDVGGDGYADVIVCARSAHKAYVYRGSAAGTITLAATVTPATPFQGNDRCAVAGDGDVNGDGFSDVIVGMTGSGTGTAALYSGSAAGAVVPAGVTLTGATTNDFFGYSVF